jgi:hypothetical protein
MSDSRTLTARSDESGDGPLIEPINRFQVPNTTRECVSKAISRTKQQYEHECILPHDLLYGIQTRIRDHLNDMPILSTTHLRCPTSHTRLRHARCAGERSECARERGGAPVWQVGREW